MNNIDKKKHKNFTRTCSRLRQFLKEKRPLGDQSLFASPQIPPINSFSKLNSKGVEEEFGSKKVTINLFPKKTEAAEVDVSCGAQPNFKSFNLFPLTSPSIVECPQNTSNNLREAQSSKESKGSTNSMTIFYAGQVLVYDDFSDAAAHELISLATQGTITNTYSQIKAQAQIATPTFLNSHTMRYEHNKNFGSPSDLPIARRTSLCKFMKKRKYK